MHMAGLQLIVLWLPAWCLKHETTLALYYRGPQPVSCSPLPDNGLFATGPCERWAGMHERVRAHKSQFTPAVGNGACSPPSYERRAWVPAAHTNEAVRMRTCPSHKTIPSSPPPSPSGARLPTWKGWGTLLY